ncbi:SUMF1/EgtB/PvdO family nonheme iron enzyme [Pelagicoccus mobilis]|uniref:SUMF1/EgtB/PvdO family nonheme iron enzyme n=1 Tax=Pelagicoccus mobilis TaxID=415221 RepID=A0A934VQ54_9BACT|nr:SUMF1/EgtB/PvdO family nonheme iron enzyme [Pelagicoccus mobilis]MBK1876218.1 SUMF1/EgtB/PvdO family nonheme iron enzyme [Pelagicoccus mobilis]
MSVSSKLFWILASIALMLVSINLSNTLVQSQQEILAGGLAFDERSSYLLLVADRLRYLGFALWLFFESRHREKLSVGWFVLGLFLGPIGVAIFFLVRVSVGKRQGGSSATLEESDESESEKASTRWLRLGVLCLALLLVGGAAVYKVVSRKDGMANGRPMLEALERSFSESEKDEPQPGSRRSIFGKGRGAIGIRVIPDEAEILVGDELKAVGQIKNESLPMGTYTISAEAEGYRDLNLTATVEEGRITKLNLVRMERLTGTVSINSVPTGANVVMDGEVVGVTPYEMEEVPTGEVEVVLQSDTHESVRLSGVVLEGENLQLAGAMKELDRMVERSDWTVPNLGIEMKWIEPGRFNMGSPKWEPGRDGDESPRHVVVLSDGYWMGKFEVSQREWSLMNGKHPAVFRKAGENAPIENITWEQAKRFCEALTKREREAGRLLPGYEYTLPTEAQWEFACRAGSSSPVYSGPIKISGKNNIRELDTIAWYSGNSGVEYKGESSFNWEEMQYAQPYKGTHEVGLKQPNAWGLYDMLGNVSEWCLDWKADYKPHLQTDPKGPEIGWERVHRGGSWHRYARFCRAAYRESGNPVTERSGFIGMRLCLSKKS